MPQSLLVVYLHVVFAVEKRVRFFQTAELRTELHSYLWTVSENLGYPPIAIGGGDNHVHLLVRLGKNRLVTEWIKEIKRVSSMWLHERPELKDFTWQKGYSCVSIDHRDVSRVAEYIKRQEEHHSLVPFEDELRKLLTRHGAPWHEEHLWS